MNVFQIIIISLLGSLGAGLGTGLAGLSAAAVIAPMLATFLGFDSYLAIGIALASDVLASAISAIVYAKHKNLDIKNGLVMMACVLILTVVGSFISRGIPQQGLGWFSCVMTLVIGLKFILKPEKNEPKQSKIPAKYKLLASALVGCFIGFICGFVGAGGGMMLLFALSSVLGYDLKKAVGTSVFIMASTALTGAVSHFVILGDVWTGEVILSSILCVIFTAAFAQLGAVFANKVPPKIQSISTGAVLSVLGLFMIVFKLFEMF